VLDETLDVLALDLTDGLPDVGPWDQRIDLRWVTDAATARDHHEVGMVVFGGEMAPDDELERAAADGRRQLPAGEGGAVVAYLDGAPVGAGGIAQPGDVARLWGGSVREEARGLGVYRALLDARLRYGRDHGADDGPGEGPHPDLRPDPAPGRVRAVRRGALVPRPLA
jgi:GNAT superfamily N-acetyltransferase